MPTAELIAPEQIVPLHDLVLIRRIPEPKRTKSGIELPDNPRKRTQRAEVVAVGPGKVNELRAEILCALDFLEDLDNFGDDGRHTLIQNAIKTLRRVEDELGEEGRFAKMRLKVGQSVIVNEFSGTVIRTGSDNRVGEHVVIRESEALALVEGDGEFRSTGIPDDV
jgi:co-chaperonin GroES (HSP10)